MNELQAKLQKRLSVVQESGLHFESSPAEHRREDAGKSSSASSPSQPAVRSAPSTSKPAGGVDFLSAMNRRRATVDDDGQTFESKPSERTATVSAAAAAAAGAKVSQASSPCIPRAGGADFRTAIERQRANVDDGGRTFESQPARSMAGASGQLTSYSAGVAQVFESKPSAHTADCVAGNKGVVPREGAASKHWQFEAEADAVAKQAPPPESATASLPTPSRACSPPPPEVQLSADAAEESDEEDGDEGEQAQEAEADQAPGAPSQIPETKLSMKRNRVQWLIGLGPSHPDHFESVPFSIAGHGPVHLELRAQGRGCQLSLHGPANRPSLKAKLFVSKGWAKKSFMMWPAGKDLVESFDVNLEGRRSILCGLVFDKD